MPTVNNKLTNLADEIRELSGTTESLGLDEMVTNVDSANAQVAEIEGLIEELNAALDGKSVSGGSASVEMCTVEFIPAIPYFDAHPVCYQTIENGQVVAKVLNSTSTKVSSLTVVCGSMLIIATPLLYASGYSASDGITLVEFSYVDQSNIQMLVLQVNLKAGETGTLTLDLSDSGYFN